MSIGDYILFIDQGKKVWEGTSDDVFDVDVKLLQDFLYAGSRLMRRVKAQT